MRSLIVIPWRPAPSRVEAFERVFEWYRRMLPEFRIVTCDTDDEVFALARTRNLGVASADDDEVVVISDADTFPEPGPVRAAVAAAARSGRVQLPYTAYRWLGPDGSAQFAEGVSPADCDYELVPGACSGVYVTTRRSWQAHGGQDERFRGWGFEDKAWYVAHETLLGAPPQRHDGRVYALHHAVEARTGPDYDRNAKLMQRYLNAAGDREAMERLVVEGQVARAHRSISSDPLNP
ncbi:galactosyltransferase-related protein [Agromyces humatus]|uniref:Galactosyltransferase C-terminal domain-containing protein n=1 Tax=Agromyces humatus TaxID=279573 RepID=A0ABN2KTI1_9MICO|nr:galactosyltransferase-related protein [Agromyces humatus]